MNVDGITLRVLINEFSKVLDSTYLKKVQMPSTGRFYFEFSHAILFCSLLSSDCYCCLTTKKESSPAHPEGFIMLLRKYLNGGRLQSVTQMGTDRIMALELTKRDEIGDVIVYRVYFEIMGRNSNLILTDEAGMIIDAWKKTITETRSIISGVPYTPYPADGIALPDYQKKGIDFLLHQIQHTDRSTRIGKFLQSQFQGMGRQNLEEILYRLDLKKNVELSQLNDEHILALHEIMITISGELNEGTLYVYENEEERTLISPMPLLNALEMDYQVNKFSPSQALEYVNGKVRMQSRISEKKKTVTEDYRKRNQKDGIKH